MSNHGGPPTTELNECQSPPTTTHRQQSFATIAKSGQLLLLLIPSILQSYISDSLLYSAVCMIYSFFFTYLVIFFLTQLSPDRHDLLIRASIPMLLVLHVRGGYG